MKKITFNTLKKLVAKIDYIWDDSYPVIFTVDGTDYACGITHNDEQQFLIKRINDICLEEMEKDEDFEVLDVEEPDDMIFDEIGKMLKEKCHITKNSVIELEDENSFDGERLWL